MNLEQQRKDDIKRYNQYIAEIDRFLWENEEADKKLSEAWYDIPSTQGTHSQHRIYGIKKYARLLKKYNTPEYHGYIGIDAFAQAREDKRYFNLALKNLCRSTRYQPVE